MKNSLHSEITTLQPMLHYKSLKKIKQACDTGQFVWTISRFTKGI